MIKPIQYPYIFIVRLLNSCSTQAGLEIGSEIDIVISMKYQQGKIKREHGILKSFEKTLKHIEKIEEVQRIIPGRIHNTARSSSHSGISFSYLTKSGLKYKLNNGGTSQECFIVCSSQSSSIVQQKITALE